LIANLGCNMGWYCGNRPSWGLRFYFNNFIWIL